MYVGLSQGHRYASLILVGHKKIGFLQYNSSFDNNCPVASEDRKFWFTALAGRNPAPMFLDPLVMP